MNKFKVESGNMVKQGRKKIFTPLSACIIYAQTEEKAIQEARNMNMLERKRNNFDPTAGAILKAFEIQLPIEKKSAPAKKKSENTADTLKNMTKDNSDAGLKSVNAENTAKKEKDTDSKIDEKLTK